MRACLPLARDAFGSRGHGSACFRAFATALALVLLFAMPHSWRLDDLGEGKVDAMSAYATVEPARLRAQGVETALLKSLDYGVEIGHMNPGRWPRIAETLVGVGLAPSFARIAGSIYDPNPGLDPALLRWMSGLGALGLASTVLVLLWNLQMRRSVRDRTRELQAEADQRQKVEARLSGDITERKRAEALLLGQKKVLEMIAVGAPLVDTLDALLRVVEAQSSEMLGSILLLDPRDGRLRHAAAPRLPEDFTRAIDGSLIGERAGSCGTAAYRREPVVVFDVATDPLWEDYRELAAAHGLRASWSSPIFDAQRRVLGTFALYFREACRPTERHLELIEMATQTAAIAIVREREEEALRASEEKFSKAFQSSPDGLVLSRLRDGALVEVNEVFLKVSGYSRAEALGRTTQELGLWVDPAARDRYLEALRKDGLVRDQPASFRGASGGSHEGLVSGEIIHLAREPLALTTIRDVTAINRIQQRLVSIYDTVGDVIFLVGVEEDGGFRFESVNQRFAATTGLEVEAVVGKRVEEVIPEASLPLVLSRYRQAIQDRAVVRWEETTDYPAGRRTGDVSVAPMFDPAGRCTHLVGAVHDITERKAAEERQARAEETLALSQKLEGIGRLAGGIAHDFNNLLNVILGYGELMRPQLGDDHAARPRLEQVIRAAQRASGLTRQLLAFSRKQILQPQILDLAAVVNDMRPMLERVVGEDLEITVRSSEPLGAVQADPTQVEQVVMNLVVNARDAMAKCGSLTLETANVDFDEAYAAAHPPAQAGQFVMLAVSDTGAGMDAETQKRIFEPFFTTKPVGEGTGLGLATVYGIVKQTGGYVWVYSEVGRGTTFKVYLPRVAQAVPVEVAAAASTPSRGHETVLVVEDTESLRDLIRELLEAQGYSVLTASEGEEAVALCQKRADAIDLLLTDVVLPKLGGGDLVRQVRSFRPEMKVLYMSGYTRGALLRHGVSERAAMIEKPFTGEQLARAVRQALEASPAPLSLG